MGVMAAQADSVLSITEFMAANSKTLRDEDQEYSDWIEIYNAGPDAANLGGWTLTDSAANLAKWTFPATNLNANAYMVVFASGKNRAVSGKTLHTGFSLNADGEYLALVSPEGEIATEFAPRFPKQFVDVSYGYRLGRLYYFTKPTPAAENSGGYNDFVEDVKFSVERGFYRQAFDLTLSTTTPGATILYTTNGSVPSLTATATNGTVYAAPLRVPGTAIIRAAAFKDSWQPSLVITHTYLFVDDIVRQSPTGAAPGPGWPAPGRLSTGQVIDYGMDPEVVDNPLYAATIRDDLQSIPSFSLVMDLKDLFNTSTGIYANPGQDTRAWERKGSVELIDPAGHDGFQVDCGVRIRGGFSRSGDNPKHAFRLFFREVYGVPKLHYPLFKSGGADTFDNLDLRTFQNYSWSFQGDGRGVFLRDQFSRDAQLAMGQSAERGDYYHLYINGQYWGLYNTCERPESSYAETYYGGSKDDYDVIKVAPDNGYTILATDGNMTAWTKLYTLCRQGLTNDAACERIQGNNPDGTRNPDYDRLVDRDNLIDYMLVILWGGNLDAPISAFLGNTSPNNFYGFRSRVGTDGFRFIAHDSEHTLLNVSEDRSGPFAAGNSAVSASNPQWVWQKMWANAEFRVQTGDRVHRHFFNNGVLTAEGARALFLQRKEEIDRAVVGESARWGDAKVTTPFTRATWLAEINNILNNFIPQRPAVVLGQLKAKGLYPSVAAPTFNQHGGPINAGFALSMTAPAGTLYYTLDGSDPRLRGGAVAPGALTYSRAVTLNESVRVNSRALVGTNWSALNTAEFAVIQTFTNLVITEIMYHPADDPDIDPDAYEFIELKNLNAFSIDVSGVHFSEGINYAFPLGRKLAPGEIVVLVKDPVAFARRHPGVPVAGTFTGNLANSGERITLVHAVGTPLFSVAYGDTPPWPVVADGQGFSLVPAHPNLPFDPDDPAAWRASAAGGGSPGADDPPVNVSPVVINEALTHTDPPQVDAVELYNPTDGAADVGGWFLTDDRLVPDKYRIPAGTVIPAGGYLVLDETQFNPQPGVDPSFTLNSHGEEVFLFSATPDGLLTGYSDGFSFGAAANGVTFGRFTNSVGEVQFPAQSAVTLGGPNAGPAVGPVVINEIHYQPAAGDTEFVELLNLTDAAVKLYNPFHPTNTWRLDGIGFEFPPFVDIAPHGMVLVVASDPAAFRASHSVPAAVPVLGPFPGVLQNSGELLQLQRPDNPDFETNKFGEVRVVVPYVTVDGVRYNDHLPWPTNAAGFGPSLERLHSAAYGNDPVNWRASFGPPSPGLDNNGNRAPIVDAGADRDLEVATFPTAVSLSGAARDDGLPNPPGALAVRWTQISGPGPVVFADATQLNTTVWLPGLGDYILQLTAGDGEVEARDQMVVTLHRPAGQVTLLPAGSTWRYLDDGSDQKTNWVTPDFNDQAWKSGKAQLGYSSTSPEGDEVTTLGYGGNNNNKYITYYFRTTFTLADPSAVTSLTAHLLRDDGAAVYLNGWPAFRDGLPEGDLTYQTLSSITVGGTDESTFFDHDMDPARLRAGVNVLAVEVHQSGASSSDLSFDFGLDAVANPANKPPTASAGPSLAAVCGEWTTLNGAFSDDGLPAVPGVPSFAWSRVSGPDPVELANASTWVTPARFNRLGEYRLRLTVNDGSTAVSDDTVVNVVRNPNPKPAIAATTAVIDGSAVMKLRLWAEAGWAYAVQVTDRLPAETWQTLTTTSVEDAARFVDIDDPIAIDRPARYYRITLTGP